MKYKCTVLIKYDNIETFRAICKKNKFAIINESFKKRDDWYPVDSYELDLIVPFAIYVINIIKEHDLYQGRSFTGIDGKDAGLSYHVN